VTLAPPILPVRRPGRTERLAEQAFGWPTPLRAWVARRAARAGLHAHALACAPEDGYVLARAGFFEEAAEHSRPGAAAWLAAMAGLGRLDLLDGLQAQLDDADRRWIAGLAAAWDAGVALRVLGDRLRLEAAAVQLHAGDAAGADARLADATASPEYWLLSAAVDARSGAWEEANDAIDSAFRDCGLAAPLGRLDRPARHVDFGGETMAGRTGGPLVSVIMAARDAAASLPMAAASIQRQTWRDLELLIVDDGSADETAAVGEALARADSRIRLLRNDIPAGAAAARNRGLEASAGAYVTFQDADDWAHPERLERQVAAVSRHGAAASVARHFRLADGAPVSPRVFPFHRLCPITVLVTAEAAAAAGPLEVESLGTDSEYLGRLDLIFGRVNTVRVPLPLVVAGWSGGSLSGAADTGLASPRGRALREAYERDWRVRHAMRLREIVG
jgi:hypothetical protein